jgi:hypothetical protein
MPGKVPTNRNESKKVFGKETTVNSDPVVIILENSGPNDSVVFEKDDIEENTLGKLTDYASTITQQAGNSQYIKPGTEKISLSSNGFPAALDTDHKAHVNSTYIDILEEEGLGKNTTNSFGTISNSKMFEFPFTKGKVEDTSIPSAESLIREVNKTLGESTISKGAKKLLEENSRYTDSDPYIQNIDENNSNVGAIHLQNKNIGQYTPRKFPEVNDEDIQFSVKQLKNLGTQLLFKASGEIYTPKDTQDVGEITKARAAALVPGQARLGIKIPVSRFSTTEMAEEVNPNFNKKSNFPELKGGDLYSHGSYYNPLVPFDSMGSSTFTKPAAILLTLTFSALLKALSKLLGPAQIPDVPTNAKQAGTKIDPKDNAPTQTVLEKRKNRLGNYLGQKGPEVRPNDLISAFNPNFLGLTITKNPYDKCVDKGIDSFFGKNALGGGPGSSATNNLVGTLKATIGIGDTYQNVSHNPAYFNIVLRFLVKTLVSTMGGLASTLGAIPKIDQFLSDKGASTIMDVEKNIGLEQDPTNIINMIGILRSAPIIRFMDVLARLGDITIDFDDYKGDEPFFDLIDNIVDVSTDSQTYPNPSALIKKNKLSDKLSKTKYNDSLAWGNDTLRSLYILPEQFLKANSDFGSDGNAISLAYADKNFSKTNVNNRLSAEQVQALELELNGYYMPFYFHDLRTNEIISFHAFIENISDSFDTEYVSTDGFGRIGKVWQYKNTNRKLGLSFKFVAVGKQDFSSMWFKINKLVMMMYPQYTEGRALSVNTPSGQQRFVQPFSQLIGSTPVIRIRVGDLIKTNYSDLDLSRLFGIGTDKFSINQETNFTPPNDDVKRKLSILFDQHSSYQFEDGDNFYLDGAALNNVNNFGRNIVTGIDTLPDTKIKAKIKKSKGGLKYDVQIIEPTTFASEGNISINFTGLGAGIVEPDMTWISNKIGSIKETITDSEYTNSFGSTEAIRSFFNPDGKEGNPIVKSFDSVRGEGLAGVMTSMNFDWSEARWDTDLGFNSKAPMLGKVDISFEVIHDINPGLDSSGMMIGAPYNIGQLMKHLKANRAQTLKQATDDSSANNASKTVIRKKKKE